MTLWSAVAYLRATKGANRMSDTPIRIEINTAPPVALLTNHRNRTHWAFTGEAAKALDERQQRGLACAVRAEQADDAAGVDGEADVVERDDVTVPATHAVEVDEVGHGVAPNSVLNASV